MALENFRDTINGLKDRFLGPNGNDDDYDEYEDDYFEEDYVDDDGPVEYEPEPQRPARERHGLLGNSARPEAESVSVYTRSGAPVRTPNYSPSVGGYTSPSSFDGDAFSGQAPMPHEASLPPSVLRPQEYNDIQSVIRRVMGRQAVVLDLRATPVDAAKRILDFSFGLAYGIEGEVEELDDRVFCVLPKGAHLLASDMDRLRREGVIR